MKIVHVSTSDGNGGAARSAFRLHQGLLRNGRDSSMLVFSASSNDPNVTEFRKSKNFWDRIRWRLQRRRVSREYNGKAYQKSRPSGYEPFHHCGSAYGAEVMRYLRNCDIINLHWVAHSFFDYESFFRRVPKRIPIVWTFHDMNAFTGGCHYDMGCDRYERHCGECPQLGSTNSYDLAFRVWERKYRIFKRLRPERLQIVSPSRWLAGEATKSPLMRKFQCSVIPYGVDLDEFAPRDRKTAREDLGIPEDAKVVLFVAEDLDNRRKGFSLLQEALAGLRNMENREDLVLVSLGRRKPELDLDIPWVHLGFVDSSQMLSVVYSAADLFVVASIQDNFPNTVLESMACGTAVIGFSVGGIPEMVRPGVNGAIVRSLDSKVLLGSIVSILEKPNEMTAMSKMCRKIAMEEYSLELQASRYAALYRELLAR